MNKLISLLGKYTKDATHILNVSNGVQNTLEQVQSKVKDTRILSILENGPLLIRYLISSSVPIYKRIGIVAGFLYIISPVSIPGPIDEAMVLSWLIPFLLKELDTFAMGLYEQEQKQEDNTPLTENPILDLFTRERIQNTSLIPIESDMLRNPKTHTVEVNFMKNSTSRNEILSITNELQQIAQHHNLLSIGEAISSQALAKLQSHRFHVVIAGEFANGKTSLINALLRNPEGLPTSSGANSSRVVEIVYGPQPKLFTVQNDGQKTESHLYELASLVQDTTSREFHLELAFPCELCRDGVVIIDTPGLQDVTKRRVAITFKYLPSADMVIYVADATKGIISTEYEFLGSSAKQFSLSGVMVALNHTDKLGGEEAVNLAQRKTEDAIESIFGKRIPVFPISAMRALRAILSSNETELKASGVPALEGYLKNFLENDKFQAVIKSVSAYLSMQCVGILNGLSAYMEALSWNPEEHEKRTTQIKQQLQSSDQRIDNIKNDFCRKLDREKSHFIDNYQGWLLNNFRAEFITKLRQSNINDLKAEYVKEAVSQLVGTELKKQWEVFQTKIEKLTSDLGREFNESIQDAGKSIGVIITTTNLSDSILTSVSPQIIAAALVYISYIFMGFISTLLLAIAGQMIDVIDWIKDWQKDKVIQEIDDSLRKSLPAMSERIQTEINKICDQIQSEILAHLTESRNAALDPLMTSLEKTRLDRMQGEETIQTRKKVLADDMEKVRNIDRRLQAFLS